MYYILWYIMCIYVYIYYIITYIYCIYITHTHTQILFDNWTNHSWPLIKDTMTPIRAARCWFHPRVRHNRSVYPLVIIVTVELESMAIKNQELSAFPWKTHGGSETRVMYVRVSWNSGTPNSSNLMSVSILNHPFGGSPFMETRM